MAFSKAKKKPRKGLFHRERSRSLNWQHRNSLSFLVLALITDGPINQCEERVVSPPANLLAGMNARTDLTHEDIARAHGLATENFNPSSLPLTVAPIAGTAAGFFMRHRS